MPTAAAADPALSLAVTDLARTLVEAGDGAVVLGGDGRIVLWNRSAERILGYTARDVMGRRCWDVLAGCDDDGNRLCHRVCRVAALLRMDEPVHSFDMRARTKSGRPIWLNVSTLRAGAGLGGPVIVHLLRDVSAAKELLTLVHERLAPPAIAPDGLDRAATLSRRELEVLRLLTEGNNTAAISERLKVSPETVKNHVQHILTKLGMHSRLEAVAFAARQRLF
jgi:PAS domain S-box-containing protein